MRELGSWQDKAVVFVPLCQSAEGKERRANLDWLLENCCTGSGYLHSVPYKYQPALTSSFNSFETQLASCHPRLAPKDPRRPLRLPIQQKREVGGRRDVRVTPSTSTRS